jgi:hypothetical protein
MVNTSISATSVIPAYRQAASQISKEKEVTGIISDNHKDLLTLGVIIEIYTSS